MVSLTDLFNPTFLMFLGILVLVVALLVVYFESKTREQNHKIASMLSLVSTLAEDMNGLKMGLNHLAMTGGQSFQQSNMSNEENLGIIHKNNLIEVSDDDDDDNADDEETDNDNNNDDDETDDEDYDDEETDNEESEHDTSDNEETDFGSNLQKDDTRVIKLQVSNEDIDEVPLMDTYEETNIENIDDLVDLGGEFEPVLNNEYVEEVLDLKYDELKNDNSLAETIIPSSTDLKTISINLGEEQNNTEDNIDYKKLQIQKLRSIAVEKGLTNNSEASKLKKNELLKLLGVE